MNFQTAILAICLLLSFLKQSFAAEVSLTFDDFNIGDSVLLKAEERNKKILDILDAHRLKTTLFVQGKNVDSVRGKALLKEWDQKGHQIANHTYSHLSYSSPQVTFNQFTKDLLRTESLIKNSVHFQRLFRFPYLHEGNRREKIDQVRTFLKDHRYHILDFEKNRFQDSLEKIRKDHFDQVAYLESVLKEMKQAKKNGAETPDLTTLLAPVTGLSKISHRKKGVTESPSS